MHTGNLSAHASNKILQSGSRDIQTNKLQSSKPI